MKNSEKQTKKWTRKTNNKTKTKRNKKTLKKYAQNKTEQKKAKRVKEKPTPESLEHKPFTLLKLCHLLGAILFVKAIVFFELFRANYFSIFLTFWILESIFVYGFLFSVSENIISRISRIISRTWLIKTFLFSKEASLLTEWRIPKMAVCIVYIHKRLETSWRYVFKRSSRRLGDQQNVYWEYSYLTNLNLYLINLCFNSLSGKSKDNLRRINQNLIFR